MADEDAVTVEPDDEPDEELEDQVEAVAEPPAPAKPEPVKPEPKAEEPKPTPLDDLKRERTKRRLAENELRRLKAEGATGEEKIKQDAKTEEQARWKSLIALSATRAALAEAGATKGIDRLSKLIDLDALDVSDDGDVDGLGSAVASLKEELPELFRQPEPEKTARPPKIDGAGKAPVEKKLSAAERISQTLMGSRG